MRHLTLIACFSAAQLFAGDPAVQPKTQETPRYSREQLERIRQSFLAQIAVHDEAENAMRAPTPEEAAALTGSSRAATATPIRTKNGGLALKSDAGKLSFAIAETTPDGKVKVSHGPAKATAKEGANAR